MIAIVPSEVSKQPSSYRESPAPGNTPLPGYIGEADFATRNAALKALANTAGFRLPDTRVPEGDSLLPIGEEAKRALQCEVEALPDVAAGLAALRARVKAESPIDAKCSLQGIRAEPSKCAIVPQDGNAALGYTNAGFDHLIAFVKPPDVRGGVGPTLLSLPPKIRADAFNYFAQNSRALPDGAVVRTIVDPASGRRVIRAVTSTKHSLVTGDDSAIADALETALPAGAKLRVTRSLDRTDLEILWPALQREIRVGDAVLFAVGVSNSETKAGSLRVEARLLRALCYNFTTAWSEDDNSADIPIRHVGDLKTKIPAAVAAAVKRIEPFVVRFADAYRLALPAFAPTRGEVLLRAQDALALPEAIVNDAGKLWDADGAASAGDTLAGLVNALTRASQAATISRGIEVERAAGRLIKQGWAALS